MAIFSLMQKSNIKHISWVKGKLSHEFIKKNVVWKNIQKHFEHEELHFFYDKKTNGRFTIAVHNTFRGPSIGGLRVWQFKTEEDAIIDVLRLSKAMTYKNAAVGLNHGGGKAIIWLDKNQKKSRPLLRAFARSLIKLEGNFVTGEDVGTSEQDMDIMQEEVKKYTKKVCVVCCSKKTGGSGNPSPFTAYGIYDGMKVCAKRVFGTTDLKGKTIALQGLGNVGWVLAKHLVKTRANLIITDIDKNKIAKVQRLAKGKVSCKAVFADHQIYSEKSDIFSPCALGGILNSKTVPLLKCPIIAGSANNQLWDEKKDGLALHKKDILYAPDFIINAGGVINAAMEYAAKTKGKLYNEIEVYKKIDEISENLNLIFDYSEKENIPTSQAAIKIAEERLKNTEV